jgi:hypothetical protein
MTTETELQLFPLYESQDYSYESFLVLSTPAENMADAGAAITAKKWAKGEFLCNQAFNSGGEGRYTLTRVGRISEA